MPSKHLSFFRFSFIAMLFFSCSNFINAQTCLDSVYNGTATFYSVTAPVSCSYPVPASPIFTAAVSTAVFDTSATCGGCILVTSTNGSVILSIEDVCSSCSTNDLDISTDADSILSPNAYPTAVQWKYTTCPLLGPVQIYFNNTTLYYGEIQIRNHRYPISKVEYWSGSQYVSLPRASYNYFIAHTGFISDTVALRITDILGDVIVENGIPLVTDSLITGAHQFPVCIPATTGLNDTKDRIGHLIVTNNPSANGDFGLINTSQSDIFYQIMDVSGRSKGSGTCLINTENSIKLQGQGLYFLQYTAPSGSLQTVKLIVD